VQDEVSKGFVPDLVFITGDLADMGLKAQYADLRRNFIDALREALGGAAWPGRILAVPGNHDVDRTRADGFDRAAPLAPRAEFFDASKTGKAKREILAPRFRAFSKEAPVDLPGGWITSP
jgi:predicted MPP superfamily phosphohydrolase